MAVANQPLRVGAPAPTPDPAGAGSSAAATATNVSGTNAIRPVETTGRIRRILLATDLGSASDLATDWAFDLARTHGAALLIISIIDEEDLVPAGAVGRSPRWDQIRDDRNAAAGRLVELGRASGIDVSFLVWTGDVADSHVSAAQAESADLAIVGSHGRGRLGRLLLGSVSEAVTRRAPCPVLVVRPRNVPEPT
jgi:nucleotide-binding universal stress UspA family protein